MKQNAKNQLVGSLLLLICAFIWGSAFVAQTTGAEHVGPFTFIYLRSFLGGIVLLPVIFFMGKIRKKSPAEGAQLKKNRKTLLTGGLACGVALCFASVFQQAGIDKGTDPGKAGFITALYILLVPLSSLFMKKRVRPIIWPCIGASVVALYLLCVTESNCVELSDLLVLICAALYTVHILVIDRVSPYVDGVKLSCIQFFVAGIISLVPAVIYEGFDPEAILAAMPSVAYAGIMSSGVAYTLQILGQQKTEPALASMIMSLESVFAVLTSMVVLHLAPTPREAIGCVIMFAAIIVAQLPERKKKN
ncbi:MAG: DMT family transporter [Clostridia bacterium]|nr:DMT family transporter [Clostridia bacterium]